MGDGVPDPHCTVASHVTLSRPSPLWGKLEVVRRLALTPQKPCTAAQTPGLGMTPRPQHNPNSGSQVTVLAKIELI